MKEVTCTKCGWVHIAYTLEQAEAEVARFNDWFCKQTRDTQDSFGGPSSIDNYLFCRSCGGTKFRPAKEDDCPIGCTLNPVVAYENQTHH